MANDRGHILNRTSFNAHQEVNAKVIGVLKSNNNIRKNLLQRNIGVYNMIDTSEGIGYIPSLYAFENRKPFSLGEDGLLGYTHIKQSDFQDNIKKRYDFNDILSYYHTNYQESQSYLNWGGKFDDYTEYMSNTVGLSMSALNLLGDLFQVDKLKKMVGTEYSKEKSMTIRSILNDFLQYDNIAYAMEKDRIGTITPNPLMALAGSITTNNTNFSGTDTPLGIIANELYALTLQRGAQFNSLRRTKHISEEAYKSLGNTLLTLPILGSIGRIDPETGRLAYEFGSDVTIPNYESITIDEFEDMDMIDGSKDIASSKNARYRNLIRNREKYLPFNGYRYETPQDITTLAGFITNTVKARRYEIWNEGDKGNWSNDVIQINNDASYRGVSEGKFTGNSLLSKTQTLFSLHNEKGIDTIIGRFHTSGDRDTRHNEVGLLQTAVSKFGMSHGRNLLTKNAYEMSFATPTNGYGNPYCRTWTYHHQYSRVADLIRPFSKESDGVVTITDVSELQKNWWLYGRKKGSAGRLNDNSVLNSNGFVNITPSKPDGGNIDIKKCMFSIENLAWKDIINGNNNTNEEILSKEQIGPNGGRIMWFPPYGLDFNESINVDWKQNDFIGRGEKIYTYTNTERSGTLSFILLVDHPSILDMWQNNGAGSNVDDNEQKILRFFAGCDSLELNNVKIDRIPEEIPTPEPNPDPIPFVEPEESENLIFYVFFPNNYSGNDEKNSDAIEYLSTTYEVTNSGSSTDTPIYPGYKWGYRVDNKYINQKLHVESNYNDLKGFSLNKNLESVKSNKDYSDATCTFYDVAIGENSLSKKITEIGRKIQSINIEGFASEFGYRDINISELAPNRVKTIETFIKNQIGSSINHDYSKIHVKNGGEIMVDDIDKNNVSGESAKRANHVRVCIEIIKDNDKISPISNISIKADIAKELSVSETRTPSMEVNNEQLTKRQRRVAKQNERLVEKETKRIEKEYKKKLAKEPHNRMSTELYEKSMTNLNNMSKKSAEQLRDNQLASLSNRLLKESSSLIHGILTKQEMDAHRKKLQEMSDKRWDSEAQYFSMLQAKDNILYSKIVDKIKYFSPAFHSITPEGFNARLGFLHQCTRQGATLGSSDKPDLKRAGNMSFGRPPVCVLRLGDFYNTKIIIDSVTITYDNNLWDMNPEGIGMQPMMAKVSLNFKFLGGSDIEAPISRLQNAVSFNYYANQSIYDNRSDEGYYDNKTAKIKNTPWLPKSGVTKTE